MNWSERTSRERNPKRRNWELRFRPGRSDIVSGHTELELKYGLGADVRGLVSFLLLSSLLFLFYFFPNGKQINFLPFRFYLS